jgi:hypothetical protein
VGISPEQKKKVEFTEWIISAEDILSKIPSLEELICDGEMEVFVMTTKK